jgi:NAD(P)-dependent dehydrogenase (short-subunit alcohol dehydrogenase family)
MRWVSFLGCGSSDPKRDRLGATPKTHPGIGGAIASAFVREGARLAAVGRNEAALEELIATLDGRAQAVPADVGDPLQAEEAVRRAAELLGGVDTVVNAAAVDCEWKPVGELPVESWDETIRIDPGVIDAGMAHAVTDPGEREALARVHPLGRLGDADEVAEAVVWLCSPAASFTTGWTLAVGGGFLARG